MSGLGGKSRDTWMKEFELTIEQLIKSRSFKIVALLLLVVAPFLPAGGHLALFVIVAGVMMAAVTSVHEMVHIRRAEELGHPVRDIKILGLGNIRYEVDSPPEVRREVARAPYFSLKPYLVEVAFLIILAVIAASATSPYNYLLLALEAIPSMHFVSTVCAHLAFRGLGCEKLARLASPEDLREGLSAECGKIRNDEA